MNENSCDSDTKFDVNDDWEVRLRRAYNYHNCSRSFRSSGCFVHKTEVPGSVRCLVRCGLRNCERCQDAFRVRVVNRYVKRILAFGKSVLLRKVRLSFAWVESEFLEDAVDFVLKKVRVLSKKWWLGFVGSVESKEKVGGNYYVHVHGISLSSYEFNYGKVGEHWERLTGSRNVRFGELKNVRAYLWYFIG